jgi:hypothetical protein
MNALTDSELQRPERFISIAPDQVIEGICRVPRWSDTGIDPADLASFFRTLSFWRHIDYDQKMAKVLQDYAYFDPDTYLPPILAVDEPTREAKRRTVINAIADLIRLGNYMSVDSDTARKAAAQEKPFKGFRIKFTEDKEKVIQIYYRGQSKDRAGRYAYQRIVVILHDRSTDVIGVRVFRNVPLKLLALTIPDVAIVPTLVTRIRFVIANIIIGRILGSLLGELTPFHLSHNGKLSAHQAARGAFLYSFFVSANQAALKSFAARAGAADVGEEFVLYAATLASESQRQVGDDLDGACEQFLKSIFGFDTDFGAVDALARLEALGIASKGEDGAVTVLEPKRARQILLRRIADHSESLGLKASVLSRGLD